MPVSRTLLAAGLALALQPSAQAMDQTWVGAAGGGDGVTFSDPLNWSTGIVPTAGDVLLFDTDPPALALPGGSYERLVVSQGGPITFSGTAELTGTNPFTSSVLINNDAVRFEGIDLTSNYSRVGYQEDGNLVVDQASQWTLNNNLMIGFESTGQLTVTGGSSVSVLEKGIWLGQDGYGKLILEGAGTSLIQTRSDRVNYTTTVGATNGYGDFIMRDGAYANLNGLGVYGLAQPSSALITGSGTHLVGSAGVTGGSIIIEQGARVEGASITSRGQVGRESFFSIRDPGTEVYANAFYVNDTSGTIPPGTALSVSNGALLDATQNLAVTSRTNSDGDPTNGYAIHVSGVGTQVRVGSVFALSGAEILVDDDASMTVLGDLQFGYDNYVIPDLSYLTVDGGAFTTEANFYLGQRAAAILRIDGNGQVNANAGLNIGYQGGTATIDLVNGTLNAGGTLSVGNSALVGQGVLNLSAGATVRGDVVELAQSGVIDMSAGGRLYANNLFGNGGQIISTAGAVYTNGLLGFNGAYVFDNDLLLGHSDGVDTTFDFTIGQTLTVGNRLTLGAADNATVEINLTSNATLLQANDIFIADAAFGAANLNIHGGEVQALRDLSIATSGDATVRVYADAELNADRFIDVGFDSGGTADVMVEGTNARIRAGSSLFIGSGSTGTLSLANGGHGQAPIVSVGNGAQPSPVTGTLDLDDATLLALNLTVYQSGQLSAANGSTLDASFMDVKGNVDLAGPGTLLNINNEINTTLSYIDTAGDKVFTVRDGARLEVDQLLLSNFEQANVRLSQGGSFLARQLAVVGTSDDAQWTMDTAAAATFEHHLYLGIGTTNHGQFNLLGTGTNAHIMGDLYISGGINAQTLERIDAPGTGMLQIEDGAGVAVDGQTINFAGGVIRAWSSSAGPGFTTSDYEQESGATLSVLLADPTATNLAVNNQAILGGELVINLASGLAPGAGTVFTVLTADQITGTFGRIIGVTGQPGLAANAGLAVTYHDDAVHATAALLGDADLNGTVAFADFTTLANNYNGLNVGKTWVQADFNGDGDVSFADFNALANNYGLSGVAPAQADIASAVAPGEAKLVIGEDGSLSIEGGNIDLNGYSITSASGQLIADGDNNANPFTFYIANSATDVTAGNLGTFANIDGLLLLDTAIAEGDVQINDLVFQYGTQAGSFTGVVEVVPEPSSLALFGLGGLLLLRGGNRGEGCGSKKG